MRLIYNQVELKLLNMQSVTRTNVYTPDGSDLLYVNWRIGATCVLANEGRPTGTAVLRNSGAVDQEVKPYTSTQLGRNIPLIGAKPRLLDWTQEQPGLAPVGLNATLTDAELRYRLLAPRKQLIISNSRAGDVWLRSPRDFADRDLNNGPRPISLDVVSASGEGNALGLFYQIETAVPACPQGSDNAVLAHRWEMSHVHDETNHLSRIVSGQVFFNGTVLSNTRLEPDRLRRQFFHPIPLGFRRTVDRVTLSMDGLVLAYQYTDTDTEIVFDPGNSGAANIEIQETLYYHTPYRVLPAWSG